MMGAAKLFNDFKYFMAPKFNVFESIFSLLLTTNQILLLKMIKKIQNLNAMSLLQLSN